MIYNVEKPLEYIDDLMHNKLIVEFKGSANVDNIVYPLNNSLTV